MSGYCMFAKDLFTGEESLRPRHMHYLSKDPRRSFSNQDGLGLTIKIITKYVYLDSSNNSADLTLIASNYIDVLQKVETDYGAPASSQNYLIIPRDQDDYVDLYDNLTTLQGNLTDSTVLLLVTLAKEALITAFHSVNLYSDNASLMVQKISLQERVNELITQANVDTVDVACANSQFGITQTVTLAPVYSYYIQVYGMPVNGTGFNPLKVSFLAEILTGLGIAPYN